MIHVQSPLKNNKAALPDLRAAFQRQEQVLIPVLLWSVAPCSLVQHNKIPSFIEMYSRPHTQLFRQTPPYHPDYVSPTPSRLQLTTHRTGHGLPTRASEPEFANLSHSQSGHPKTI